MFWLLLAILVVLGAFLAMRRRTDYESVEEEPWRASLMEEDEPLDMEGARRAEEEFYADSWEEEDEEPWRG